MQNPGFGSFAPCLLAYACALLFCSFLPRGSAAVLYATDFSNFTRGDDRWVGQESWTGNSVGERVHGIATNLVTGLGQSAWLGYAAPSTNFVWVGRGLGLVSGATPAKVSLRVLIGVEASLNGSYDTFNVSFYNSAGAFLAGVKLDTSLSGFGVWRDDGVTQSPVSSPFAVNKLFYLRCEIHYPSNRWSGYINDSPLFENAQFTATVASRNAGSYAFEWEVASLQNPGDNWLLVDDLTVSTPEDLRFTSIVPSGGSPRLEWIAGNAGACWVQVSTNLTNWADLPGAVVQAPSPGSRLSYTDQAVAGPRFYRIRQ